MSNHWIEKLLFNPNLTKDQTLQINDYLFIIHN